MGDVEAWNERYPFLLFWRLFLSHCEFLPLRPCSVVRLYTILSHTYRCHMPTVVVTKGINQHLSPVCAYSEEYIEPYL